MSEDLNAGTRGFFGIALGYALKGIEVGAKNTPLGSWGFLIGMAVGTLLFPPKYARPDKYTELEINTAQTDIPIPLLYGTMKMGGNYVWRGDLTAVAVKSSSGGSGSKRVSGYKYYMNVAIGFCQGIAKITRMWANDDLIRLNSDPTVTIYQGLTDQTTDPLISTSVENPVPYRGLCYGVYDDFYIGENNDQAPVLTAEAHRYPFNASAGSSARVYTYVNSVRDTSDGFTVKMMDGKIVTVTQTEIRVYNKEMDTVEKTIDISAMIGAGAPVIMDVKYQQGLKDIVYVLFKKQYAVMNLRLMGFPINDLKDGQVLSYSINLLAKTSIAVDTNQTFRRGAISFNDDYVYVAYKYGASGGDPSDEFRVKQYAIGGFLSTTKSTFGSDALATFDITSDIDKSIGGDSLGMDITEDVAIIGANEYIYSFDLATFTLKDSVDVSAKTSNVHSLVWLRGGDEVAFAVPSGSTTSTLQIVGFDRDGDNLTYRDEIDLSGFWETTPTWNLDYAHLSFNYDGTLFVSYVYGDGIQYIIMDANPSQVFYDIFVEERDVAESRLDLTSMLSMSDYCRDNYIGVSLLLNVRVKTSEFIQNLLSYIHGIMFINNDGKYEFKIYKNTDATVVTIDSNALSKREYQKVEVSLKDRDLISNRIDIKYIDRLYDYKESSFQSDNFLAQEQDGEVRTKEISYIWISNIRTASRQGYKILKFEKYDTKVFQFYLLPKFLYLKIGDVVALDFADQSLNNQRVRIMSLEEPALSRGGDLNVIARLEADYLNTFKTYKTSSTKKKSASVPLPVEIQPIVFEQPPLFNNDTNTICIAFIRKSDVTIAVDVYVAEDDLNYTLLGSIDKPAIVGDLHRALGAQYKDKDIYVDTSDYVDAFAGFTVVEQRNNRSFSLIGVLTDGDCELSNLEFVTYRDVDQNGNVATLSKCYRGKYYTLPKAHVVDEVLLDVEFGRYLNFQYPNDRVGKTFYIKCLAKNIGGEIQDFDDAVTYEYTLKGYTTKATHVDGVELRESGVLLGGSDTTVLAEPEIVWKNTNRVGGMASLTFNEWLKNRVFVDGDLIGYHLYIYDSTLVLKATRTLGDVQEFTYTVAMQTTDFGAPPSEFYIDIEPFNARGSCPDIFRKHVVLV